MSNNKPIQRPEFLEIARALKNGSVTEVATSTGRSKEAVRKVRRAGSWPKYQQMNEDFRAKQSAKKDGQSVNTAPRKPLAAEDILDSLRNPTKKQLKEDLKTWQGYYKTLEQKYRRVVGQLNEYQKRDAQEAVRQARKSRGVLAFLRRTK